MLIIVIFILTAITVVNSTWDHTNHCAVESCEGRPHTFWVYRTDDPAAACDEVIKAGLTALEKRKILDLHNDLRQKVARGEEKRGNPGPQPPARYMRMMEWDDELADLAQRWANQCNFDVDQCRNVERFEVYQSVIKYDVKDIMKVDVKDIVKIWYDEVDKFDANAVSNFPYELKEEIRTYTQMVWADSYKLGCGGMRYPVPSNNRFLLVCNYGPSGNIIKLLNKNKNFLWMALYIILAVTTLLLVFEFSIGRRC